MMPDARTETSGIRFPPPLVYLVGFVAGYLLERVWPIRLLAQTPTGAWRPIAWSAVGAGILLMGSAVVAFRRAGTTPNPTKPVTAFVTRGPYRFTRNPMYVGWVLVYLGAAVLVRAVWPLVLLPVVLTVMQRWVITREEAYLERRFGEEYRAYKARVRRWL